MDNDSVVSESSSSKKVKNWSESFVPDCLVIDILSRLQLKNVIQCRCVCKSWRDLLSTPEFIALHKQRGMGGNWQMILVDEPKIKKRIDLFYMDEWQSSKKPIVRRIHSYPSYRTLFSQEGFLVMSSSCCHSILIVNPTGNHGVKIVCQHWVCNITNVYGIFFNPTLKEYCVLLGVTHAVFGRKGLKPCISYRLLTLGAKPCWRHLSHPFNRKLKYDMSTLEWARPVLVGDFLYWQVDPIRDDRIRDNESQLIMEFNTRTEEFVLIHAPQTQCFNGISISTPEISLLNIDGFLSCIQTFTTLLYGIGIGVEIDVWTLKDRVAQLWAHSMYSVTVDNITVDPLNFKGSEAPKPLAVEYGHLIFQFHTTLFACNLKGSTTRICGKKKHNKNSRFFSHSISLSSLKNCKPVICMEGVDEKEYKEYCKVCRELFKEETSSGGVNKHSDVVDEPSTSNRDDGGGCQCGTSIPEQINPTSSTKL